MVLFWRMPWCQSVSLRLVIWLRLPPETRLCVSGYQACEYSLAVSSDGFSLLLHLICDLYRFGCCRAFVHFAFIALVFLLTFGPRLILEILMLCLLCSYTGASTLNKQMVLVFHVFNKCFDKVLKIVAGWWLIGNAPARRAEGRGI